MNYVDLIYYFILIQFLYNDISCNNNDHEIKKCYDCICRGAVDCGITYTFWKDGGNPHGTRKDYKTCMINSECARYTMKQYYKKFKQDCNGDEKINCLDYVKIHIYGGYGCKTNEFNIEFEKIKSCLGSDLKDYYIPTSSSTTSSSTTSETTTSSSSTTSETTTSSSTTSETTTSNYWKIMSNFLWEKNLRSTDQIKLPLTSSIKNNTNPNSKREYKNIVTSKRG